MRNIDFLSIIRKISNRPQLSLKQIFTPNVCTVERRGARAVCLVSNIARIVHSDLFFQHKIMYLYLICASIKQRPISCMLEQLMCAFASNIDARCTTLRNGQESFSYRLNQTGPPISVIHIEDWSTSHACLFVRVRKIWEFSKWCVDLWRKSNLSIQDTCSMLSVNSIVAITGTSFIKWVLS